MGTLLTLACTSSALYAEETGDDWKHSISIYGWLPSIDGTFKYTIPGNPDDPSDPDKEGESNALDALDMVFMGNYQIRKNEWSFLADMIYLKMSDTQETSWKIPIVNKTIKARAEEELTIWLLGFYGGYNTVDTNDVTLDIIAGMRYFSLDFDATLAINNRQVGISPSIEYYDAVIGVKGAIDLSKNWYIPYHFDIGAGDSDLTWQASSSLGYRFDWGDILLTYRHMHYGKDNSKLIEDFDLYGPKLGVVLHF